MLFLMKASLAKPAGVSNKEFYGVWRKEAEAALAAQDAGVIKALYKVPGKHEVIAILEAESADFLDEAVEGLPIWKMGYSHIVTAIEWTPLRPYKHWADHLKKLAQEG